jgi:bifunctional ADP-heptose synthase (sugar kinase/adenylyltransferase)
MPASTQSLTGPASRKLIPAAEAPTFFESVRRAGKRIVHSHGIWDLIRPGHICHLEEARDLGDVLVVSLTADAFVQKGPGRPCFNQQLRLRSLAALACVDHLLVVEAADAVPAIEAVRPHLYCKGREYEDPNYDLTGNLGRERDAVQRSGGQLRFIGSVQYSSTKLLSRFFEHLSGPVREFCGGLASQVTREEFHDAVEGLRKLRVLIVGDTIFDRYSYLRVQGLTSKNRIISGRFLNEETQCGGALAVFRHVKQLVEDVRFVSLLGTEPWVADLLKPHLAPEADRVVRDPAFTTIIKQRFVEPLAEGKELSKLFAVNFLDAQPPSGATLEKLRDRVRAEIRASDVVLLLDFGHGMMQEELRRVVQEESSFLALNCQTNSNNHGFNILSRQYRRADAFALDEQELLLAAGRRQVDFRTELETLRRQLSARFAWLTRGAVQTIGLRDGQDPCLCPPLECDVVDTVGAGDAFFSVAALAAARGLPIGLATFLGQLAGAQAVRIVGNAKPISRQNLIQSGMALLES